MCSTLCARAHIYSACLRARVDIAIRNGRATVVEQQQQHEQQSSKLRCAPNQPTSLPAAADETHSQQTYL